MAGHFNDVVLVNLSAALGMGIPPVGAFAYGMGEEGSVGAGAKGSFAIGIVGAALGVPLAILMGDQPWSLLAFAPLSSGITGAISGAVGERRGRPAAA